MPDSEGGVCDILAYAPTIALRSSWSTIASPRFNIYERDRSCDDLNSLNLDKEEPKSRILTGKKPIVNIAALPPRPSFSGISGNSFYHVQPISKLPASGTAIAPKPVYSVAHQSKPEYTVVVPQPSNQKIDFVSQTGNSLHGKLEFYF